MKKILCSAMLFLIFVGTGYANSLVDINDAIVEPVDREEYYITAILPVDNGNYEGIWQNTENELSYYSIRTKDQQVVLIDLSGIELTRNTLESTYIGSNINGSILMSRVSPPTANISLRLSFQSSNEGTIVPGCVVSETIYGAMCDFAPITIRKVF